MRRILRLLVLVPIILGTLAANSLAFDVPALNNRRVNDNANLLTVAKRENLEEALRSLEDKTTVQVAILTVKDLQGQDIKSYSIAVAKKWQLGQKGKDNGLLLLYTVQEDKYRLEVGYGLEGAIPDGKAGDIIRQQLRAHADPKKGLKDFDGAFGTAVNKISEIVLDEYAKDPSGESMRKHTESDGEVIIGLFFIALLALGFLGLIHPLLSTAVGGGAGAVIALAYSLGMPGVITIAIIGAFVGFIIGIIARSLPAGGGGYSSSSSWGSSGSSGGGGGFSGGGGDFGGGGADG